jgi:formaldehyde-activating enzyme involved in methanogenesis
MRMNPIIGEAFIGTGMEAAHVVLAMNNLGATKLAITRTFSKNRASMRS